MWRCCGPSRRRRTRRILRWSCWEVRCTDARTSRRCADSTILFILKKCIKMEFLHISMRRCMPGLAFAPEIAPAEDVSTSAGSSFRGIMDAYGDSQKEIYVTGGWNDHPRWAWAVLPGERVRFTQMPCLTADHWPWCPVGPCGCSGRHSRYITTTRLLRVCDTDFRRSRHTASRHIQAIQTIPGDEV